MKKNKIVASIATIAMVTSMMSSVVMAEEPAWNTNGGSATVDGIGYPTEPVIEVIIPTDISFVVNPLRTLVDDGTEDGSVKQIIAPNYEIINASNVPVVVDASTKLTVGSNVDLLSTAAFDTNTFELTKSSQSGKKSAFVVLSVPTAISFDSTNEVMKYTIASADVNTPATPAAAAPTIKDASTAKAAAKAVLGSTAQTVKFALSAMSEANYKAAKCSSAFTLEGYVDPQSTFTSEDITVKTVYTLNAVTPNQMSKGYEADSTNFTGAHSSIVKAK